MFARLQCGWFISAYVVNLLLTCEFGLVVGGGFSDLVVVLFGVCGLGGCCFGLLV